MKRIPHPRWSSPPPHGRLRLALFLLSVVCLLGWALPSDANFTLRQGDTCPTVTSFTRAGNVGATVIINGTNLSGAMVRFSNNLAATVTASSNTQISVTVPAGASSGPITLSKAGCPDRQTANFIVCPNAAQTAQVDDGQPEFTQSDGTNGQPVYYVNRLQPASYPATLNRVSLLFSSANNIPGGAPLTILVGANADGDANINNTSFQMVLTTITALNQFVAYDVPAVTINSGDFVIGYSIARTGGQAPALIDTDLPQGRSYVSSDGANFTLLAINLNGNNVNPNLPIRAQYFTGCNVISTCPTVTSINPGSGAIGTTVTITGARFTGVNAVKFSNNVNATFAVSSDTSISTTVPTGAITGPLTISKPDCNDVQTASFTVAACPTITGITPTSGPVGSTVTINGGGLSGVGTVRFSNNIVAQFTINSDAQIVATVPQGAVDGPLTISKNNCPDVQTASFIITPTCTFTINPASQQFGPAGGNGAVNVAASNPACGWTAASNAAWITLTSPANNTGNGAATFSVAPNIGLARTSTLTIAGQTFTVAQAAGCIFTISPSNQNFTSAGGNGTIMVAASDVACTWTAASHATWITLNSGANGAGTGSVTYSVAANSGAVRSGTISVAGQTFTVTQESGCFFTINPTNQAFAAAGGTGTVNVTASGTNCIWTALSNAAWLTINSGAQGAGSSAVSFTAAANGGLARTGTLTVAGQTFTVTQEGGCSFTVNPTAQNFAAAGGSGTVAVVASNAVCTWTATSNATWLTITAGAEGAGTGTVAFAVAVNNGSARMGTLTIAGRTFTVTQDAACVFSLSPIRGNFTGAGGGGVAHVTASNAACTWTATSNAPWITLASPIVNNGSAPVSFTVAANDGPARTGTLTLAGLTFTVSQEGGCAFVLTPASQNFAAAGGNGSVALAASSAACTWLAVSNVPWLVVSAPANGSGNGTINFTVAANSTGSATLRTGHISVGGQTFTVIQEGACAYTFSPATQNFTSAGGTGTVAVTATEAACSWLATSTVPWLTVTSTQANTGNATVTYLVAANNGAPRTGVILLAGQNYTVTQDAAADCSFSLTPVNQSFPAAGGDGTVTVTASNPAGAACTWTAVSNAPWLTVTSGAEGTGNGTVAYTVAANAGAARNGTLTIAGQTVTIFQTAACQFTLSPASSSFAAAGGNGSVTVAVSDQACTWTATSNAPWLTINSPLFNTGGGTVNFTAAANSGTPRTGTLTIAGQTFTVAQEGGCTFTINPTNQNFPASGGSGTVAVAASSSPCAWTALSGAQWISITGGASNTGNGSFDFSVAANNGPQRTGTISVGGQLFTITQEAGCNFRLSETSRNFGAAGGSGSVTLTASGLNCTWVAASNVNWITINSGGGTGSGAVNYTVAANAGPPRTGTLNIAGLLYTVTQEGACNFTLSASSRSFAAAGGNETVTVTASNAACTWTAVSNAAWLTITAGASNTGSNTVSYSVAVNAGAARTGTMTIAGQTFTVMQEGACIFTINPVRSDLLAAGGTGTVAVTASNENCAWTAVSQDSWISITSGASGAGNGTVAFSVAANNGPPRTGTVNIAGQTLTINQAATCTFTLDPTSRNFEPVGGNGSVSVTTQANCVWTAVSNVPWLTVAANAGGAGSGSFAYSVAANTGPQRTGTITAGGQTFTVTQGGNCTIAISPTSQDFTALGGNGTINITASNAACTWAAASNVNWITFPTSASGVGNGLLNFAVAANSGPARSGTITIAGQNFTVNQASGCVYALSSPVRSFGATGGNGVLSVTAGAGCQWTAVSNAPWLTIAAPVSSAGDGLVNYVVAANNGLPRTGTISLGGQSFTITQSGGCTFSLLPASQSAGPAAGTGTVTVVASNPDCSWTAVSNVAWLSITSGASGAGNGVVAYSSAANSGPARTGTITIAGQTFTISQGAGTGLVASVSAASFTNNGLAPDSIAAAFGANLATGTQTVRTQPLPTSLLGTTVRVRDSAGADRLAQLFFVSAGQVNYLVPPETAVGQALVTITSGNGQVGTGQINIARTAPALFAANGNGRGVASGQVLRVRANGTQVFEPLASFAAASGWSPVAVDLGPVTEQVFLILYGTGLRNRSASGVPTARIGPDNADVLYAGRQGTFVGLDQVNIRIPRSAIGRGEVEVVVTVDGQQTNAVRVLFR